MPTYNKMTRQRVADIVLGLRVDRDAATHAAATTHYFKITGGKVLLTGLIGEITVASTANACSWVANPTAGTATQAVCAALDIDPAVVGDALTIPGAGNAAMTYGGSATGTPMMGYKGQVLCAGYLDFIAAAAVGATKWSLFYVPIDDGAYVEAV